MNSAAFLRVGPFLAGLKLLVSDLEASVRWYQDVMGIPFTLEFKDGDNEAWLNVGGVALGFIRSPCYAKRAELLNLCY